jgi:hypothetical protein
VQAIASIPEIIVWFLGQVVVAAAIWGGIRADIKGMHERLDRMEKRTDDAHRRIDEHLQTDVPHRNR